MRRFLIYEKYRWNYSIPASYYIYRENPVFFQNEYLDNFGGVSNKICLFSDLYMAAKVLRAYYKTDEHIKIEVIELGR